VDAFDSEMGSVVRSFEQDNKPSSSIQGGGGVGILNQLNDY